MEDQRNMGAGAPPMTLTQLQPPAEIVPKPGMLTSAFILWAATFLIGGLITFLVRAGLPLRVAEDNRGLLIEATRELLPMVWITVTGYLGKAVIAGRAKVTEAKATALLHWARAASIVPAPALRAPEGTGEDAKI